MAYRRYRRRRSSNGDDESPIEAALSAAFASGWAAAILFGVFVVIAAFCFANPKGLSGLSSVVGTLCPLLPSPPPSWEWLARSAEGSSEWRSIGKIAPRFRRRLFEG